LRSWLSYRQLNQYGVAALSAIMASGLYVLLAALANSVGFKFAYYPAGFIASVLFLVPGFPLIAALFDLLQFQTVAAMSRLAYGVMILLAVAFGLCIVIAVAGVDLSRQPPNELAYPLKLLLRATLDCSLRLRNIVQQHGTNRAGRGLLSAGSQQPAFGLDRHALDAGAGRLFWCSDHRAPGRASGPALQGTAYRNDRGTDRHYDTRLVRIRNDRAV